MGDPVTTATVGAIIYGGSEGASAFLSGRQQRSAYKMEARQLETQKKAIEANAAIAQQERLDKLKSTLALQNAMFAMRGQPTGFGSAGAIELESMSEANRERYYENLQKELQISTLNYNIWSAKNASKYAMQNILLSKGLTTASEFGQMLLKGSFSGGNGGDTGGGK